MVKLSGFETTARRLIADGAFHGVAAMVADESHELYRSAFGFADLEKRQALRVDDVFFIASMTKIVTALACVQLIEQGRLGLEDDASAIVPKMVAKVLAGFDANGQPLLRAPKRRVTVRHLLTHTSGQTTDLWNADTIRYVEEMKLPPVPGCRPEAFMTPLVFDPGEGWEYGVGSDWIGQIVEKVSGQRLDAYFKQHIFDPIGMTETSFILSPAQRARLVPVQIRQPDGSFRQSGFEVSQTPEMFMGGAGLYGTISDYIKFLQMFLNDGRAQGGRVLRPETVALFTANHIGTMEWPGMKTAIPAMSADVELLPGIPKRWSLGALRNETDVPGRRKAGSQFWAGLANSYFWFDRTSKLAGVTASAYFPFADPAAVAVFDALEQDSYKAFRPA
ncbi:MAG TPA: serine hydrolase domain-containing protein [Reyranella sp.]